MSGRISKEKAKAVATEYCKNGYKKAKALIDNGYSVKYARTGRGLKVFDNALVLAAITEIEDNKQAKAEYNYDVAMSDLNTVIANLREQCKQGNTSANQVLIAAIRERNDISGLHKQHIVQSGQGLTINVSERVYYPRKAEKVG